MAPVRLDLEAERIMGEVLSIDPVGRGEKAADGSIPHASGRMRLLLIFMMGLYILCYVAVVYSSVCVHGQQQLLLVAPEEKDLRDSDDG